MPCSNHILVVPNSESTGKTYVIGDVHGEIEAFNEVLSELKPHDTLIVAGDLIDRGGVMDAEAGFVPASKQIMDTILRHANAPAGTMPKIYAIKGNHELDFLNILKAIDLLKIPENCNAGFRIKVGMVLANFLGMVVHGYLIVLIILQKKIHVFLHFKLMVCNLRIVQRIRLASFSLWNHS